MPYAENLSIYVAGTGTRVPCSFHSAVFQTVDQIQGARMQDLDNIYEK